MAQDNNKAKVVIVEDDAKLRKFLEVFLSAQDFAVYSAGDGAEGLSLIRQIQPAVVIADVMMPAMDGHQMLRQMRLDPSMSGIPLIFLSARTTVDDKIAGLNFGADDYVVKPFAPQELASRIRALMRRAAAKPAAERAGRPMPKQPVCSIGKQLNSAGMFAASPDVLLAGQLSAVSLIDVLQSISWSGVSGRLEICGADHGRLEIRNGQVMHAQVNTARTEVRGSKAWFRMACWTEGIFEFLDVSRETQEPSRTIETPLQNLLMDAAYYRDEVLRVRGMFPPINFELLQQRSPTADAELMEHAVYQAVGPEGTTLDVLVDQLDYSDLEILQAAFKLMMAGQLGLKLSMM